MTTLELVPAGFGAATSPLPPADALLIRPSSYASYALCAYRLLLIGEDEYDPGSNEAPGKGTGTHAVIEHFLTTGEILDQEGTLALWAKVMQDRGEDLWSYASEKYLTELAIEIKHAFMVWFNTFWPTIKDEEFLSVEQRVIRGLGVLPNGREVWVSGAPDLILPGRVIDWKTAGRGWKEGKALSNSVQINTYAWLGDHLTDASLGVHCVYDWSKRTWSWDETTLVLTPETKKLALRALWDMAASLDAGIGVATPHIRGGFGDGRGWHCKPKFCPAWNACPHKGLIPDGMDQEVRPPIRWDQE